MGKNIILCADGTGNKGGYTPSSNVYKIYNAVKINKDGKEDKDYKQQIRFYDNGVGTEKNKYYRGLAGAFGLGFKSNVIDLYTYLAKNYEPGDQVYLFGFSRGAATVRAFAGFIATCGLVKGKNLDKPTVGELLAAEQIRSQTNNAPEATADTDTNTDTDQDDPPVAENQSDSE